MSKRPLGRLLSFLLLSMSAVLYGCEAARDSSELVGPQMAFTPQLYTAMATRTLASDTTVKVVIGKSGGVIRVRDHALFVTERAVNEDTEFTFRVVGGATVWVDLTARRVRDGAPVTRFQRNMLLQLSYKDGLVTDPHRLFIGYLTQGKRHGLPVAKIEKMSSTANIPDQTVHTLLNHFSEYEIGIN